MLAPYNHAGRSCLDTASPLAVGKMPLPSTPAGAIAQTIADKQRKSNVFDHTAPMRRPSACAADQQTQLFARNLRTQVPRSPSLSHRSSSSLLSQPQARPQLNYMRETSSSRRRGRNPTVEDTDRADVFQPQPPSTASRSASRLRSQSPYRSANPPVPTASTSLIPRRAPSRQRPPLPRGRPPSASRGFTALGRNASREQPEESSSTKATHGWQIEQNRLTSLSQRPQQNPEPLSNSWIVRDPLKSANSAQVDSAETEDDAMQLDASDMRELQQYTASFERNGLSHPETANPQQFRSFVNSSTAPSSTGDKAIHRSDMGTFLQPDGSCNNTGVPLFPSVVGRPSQRCSTELQQRQGVRAQVPQAVQQQQQLCSFPRFLSQQMEMLEGLAPFGKLGAATERTSTGHEAKPGVAPFAFGECMGPSQGARSGGILWRVFDLVCWSAQLAVIVITCTWRLLNTSYDSWSTRHFKECFTAMLSSKGLLQVPTAPSSISNRCLEENNSSSSLKQHLPGRLSAATIARRSEQQQLSQQQQHSREQYPFQRKADSRSSFGSSPLTETNTAEQAIRGYLLSDRTAEAKKLAAQGFQLIKMVFIAGAALCALYWLLTLAPKEESVDFDFM